MNMLPEKEIKRLEGIVQPWTGFDNLVISNEDDYNRASNYAGEMKKAFDSIEARRKEITAPINDSLRSVNRLFKQFADPINSSMSLMKSKMMDYKRVQLASEEWERAKIAAKVESGYYKPETGAKKIADVAVIKSNDSSGIASLTKYRVVDITKVPVDYLEVNMMLVKESFQVGIPVPGIEQYKDISIRIKK